MLRAVSRAVSRILRLTVAATVVVATGTLTACSGALVAAPVEDGLPPGVTIELYQGRSDSATRRMQIAITNAGEHDLTITSAQLQSTQFSEPAVWNARAEGTLVRAGTGVDLPVRLSTPACEDPTPIARVQISFAMAEGRRGSAEVLVTDRYGQLPAMRAQECFAVSIGEVVAFRIDRPVRVVEADGRLRAFVPIAFSPTGNAGTVRIESVEDTVLLALAGTDARATDTLPLGLDIAGNDLPGMFEIPILPGRCDPHAIAEDKQGTIFVLHARAPDGRTAPVQLSASEETRSSIYQYVSEACGMPS